MNEQEPRPILGLNFLQDMKGDSAPITGAYDPEQEVWIPEELIQGGGLVGEQSTNRLFHTKGTSVHIKESKRKTGEPTNTDTTDDN
jgi:hypothetical protein